MDIRSIENKLKKKCPSIFLIDIKPIDILDSAFTSSKTIRSPMNAKDLYILDIQTLFCHIFLNQCYTTWPRWCRIMKPANFSKVHLIVLEGLTSHMWSECLIKYSQHKKFKKYYEALMVKMNKSVKFVNPTFYGLSWRLELLEIINPFLSKNFNLTSTMDSKVSTEKEKRNLKRKLTKAFCQSNDFISLIHKKYDINVDKEFKKGEDAFPRTELLMSLEQMKRECIPLYSDSNSKYVNFKYSMPHGYTDVTPKSPLFAIDCEMVECHDPVTDKCVKGLASVSIVNENSETIYHTFVKPKNMIVNYLTRYSGITYEIMEKTTRTLEDVQNDISRILPSDAILVGHSIGNDLEALQLFHPYLIDTSIIYNLKHIRNMKPKLKLLSQVFLNRDIQCAGKDGHDSQEDAIATMDLVLLKLSRNLDFGDTVYKIDVTSDPVDNTKALQQPHIVNVESRKIEIPDLVEKTKNVTHLCHKNKLKEFYERNECTSLLKFVDQYHIDRVASVNDDMSGFSRPWVPLMIQEQSENDQKSKNEKSHSLCISEINFSDLVDDELPNKKWMTRLLKKIVKEFNDLPANALCSLILVDGPYSAEKPESEYGKAYFGISPLKISHEVISPTIE